MTTPFMASRLGFRAIRAPVLRNNASRFAQRRTYQSAAENPANVEASPAAKGEPTSGLSKFLNSPVGPKTVHFWAPIMKWGLVLAGAADFARPAEQLSLSQNMALMATGLIWTRWCFVIKPRNLFLASVNFLLFCVGATQTTRVLRYQSSLKGDSVEEEIPKAAREEGKDLMGAVKDPKGVVEEVKHPK